MKKIFLLKFINQRLNKLNEINKEENQILENSINKLKTTNFLER